MDPKFFTTLHIELTDKCQASCPMCARSAKSTEWWTTLAKVMEGDHEVVFGIDGFADSHVLYRKGTDWNKIIKNATAFMQAGGKASIDCLVFEHNEHEVERFEKEMLSLGFYKVNFKTTGRFYDLQEFPVHNRKGEVEYTLKPAKTENFVKEIAIPIEKISKNLDMWYQKVAATEIDPICMKGREIFVDARGNVFPCCWVGSEIVEEPLDGNYTIQRLRNLLINDSKSKFTYIPNLNDKPMHELVLWDDLDKLWKGPDKAWSCVKNCPAQ